MSMSRRAIIICRRNEMPLVKLEGEGWRADKQIFADNNIVALHLADILNIYHSNNNYHDKDTKNDNTNRKRMRKRTIFQQLFSDPLQSA